VQGELNDVTLRRMARSEMADNVQMFELFTRVKLIAFGDEDSFLGDGSEEKLSECIDECIVHWTTMLHADVEHDETVAANILDMQSNGNVCIQSLREALGRAHTVALEMGSRCNAAETNAASMLKERDLCLQELSDREHDLVSNSKAVSSYREQIQRLSDQIEKQTIEITAHQPKLQQFTRELDDRTRESRDDSLMVKTNSKASRVYVSLEEWDLKMLLRACEEMCANLAKMVSKDVLAVPTRTCSTEFAFNSTVLHNTITLSCLLLLTRVLAFDTEALC